MSLKFEKKDWTPVLILGSLWGLSEAALGMYLRRCAASASGSLMTGAALFFLAAGWAIAPRIPVLAGMVVLACKSKCVDEIFVHLATDGIQRIRTIERNRQKTAGARQRDGVEGG